MEIDFFKDAAADKTGKASSGSRAAEQGASAAILSWSVNGDAAAAHLRAKAVDEDLTNQLGITIAASRDGPHEKAAAAAHGSVPTALSVGYPAGTGRSLTSQVGGVELTVGMTAGKDGARAAPATAITTCREEGSVPEAATEDLASLSKQELISKVWRGLSAAMPSLRSGPCLSRSCLLRRKTRVACARACLQPFVFDAPPGLGLALDGGGWM